MHRILALTLLLVAAAWFSAGRADDAGQTGADQIGSVVRSQDLDAYWADQATWLEYGYRPQVQVHNTPLAGMPTDWSSPGGYAYGDNPVMPSLDNPLDKHSVQLSEFGTWH